MTALVPPRSRRKPGYGGDGGARRSRRRLVCLDVAVLTILAAAWLFTLGPIPAILGLLVAKHVLVALLMAGLEPEGPPGGRGESGAPDPSGRGSAPGKKP
jgi:hypothetical protein